MTDESRLARLDAAGEDRGLGDRGDAVSPPRAGIVVTGTEVLDGRVGDRNGPWLADRLSELGVDLAYTVIVGDRPEDMAAVLRFMAQRGLAVILTSGGLGPTADDLTAEVVGRFQGREMVHDEALEGRIADILAPLLRDRSRADPEAIRAGSSKQAMVPNGATILEPVGTAPGLVVPPSEAQGGPTVVVLPGPPSELQPMWRRAVATDVLRTALRGAGRFRQRTLRLFGTTESDLAQTLRAAERAGLELKRLEVTTCQKRGEIEVVTRYEPDAESAYQTLARVLAERHPDALFSRDGSSVDEQVAALLRGLAPGAEPPAGDGAGQDLTARSRTIATAESCTGGLLAARLTEQPGASAYVTGGIVAYSNAAKVSQLGVPHGLIDQHDAVSAEVARALADGARSRLGADLGVGVTGVAGPDGGNQEKPVGLVWLSVTAVDGCQLTRSVRLPGARAQVRDRATTVAMHLIRRMLLDLQARTPTPEDEQ